MNRLQQQALVDMARASSASGKIIEAHADDNDMVCRVVVEMSDGMRHMQLREAILQLWMQDGFIVSASRDSIHLFIDGLMSQNAEDTDLIAAVAHQIKVYTQKAMQRAAEKDMGSSDMAIIAQQALQHSDSASLH